MRMMFWLGLRLDLGVGQTHKAVSTMRMRLGSDAMVHHDGLIEW